MKKSPSNTSFKRHQKKAKVQKDLSTQKEQAVEVLESVESELFKTVRAILSKARAVVYTTANAEMVKAYWNVGREIVEKQGGLSRATYGDGLIKSLADRLTVEFGEGFTASNLFNMRQFYLAFPKFYTLRRELSWSHYRILMRIEKLYRQMFLSCGFEGWEGYAAGYRANATLQALLRTGDDAAWRQSANWHRSWFFSRFCSCQIYAQ